MLQDEDYDSDTSDEDFVPQGAESEDEPGSEVEEVEELDDDDEAKTTGKVKKKKAVRKKKKNPLLADLEEPEESSLSTAEDKEVTVEKAKEKEENLWADFLADVEDKPSPPPKPKASSWASLLGNKKTTSSSTSASVKAFPVAAKKEVKKGPSSNPSTVKITKVFEFAGEEVRVEKEVDVNSDEAKLALASPESGSAQDGLKAAGVKRPSGLSGIMGLIDNKKQKLTTLEKTKLDWNSFKTSEGIDEELESHKKSKDGYLDKQAFLERADHRQFEIERAMRMSKRSNR